MQITTKVKRLFLALLAVGLVAAMSMSQTSAEENQHDGFFVGVNRGMIVIATHDRTASHALPLANVVFVTRNGRDASLKDLVRGDLVQLKTQTWFGHELVVAIAGLSTD